MVMGLNGMETENILNYTNLIGSNKCEIFIVRYSFGLEERQYQSNVGINMHWTNYFVYLQAT